MHKIVSITLIGSDLRGTVGTRRVSICWTSTSRDRNDRSQTVRVAIATVGTDRRDVVI